jgi:hypothetical protein
MVNCPCGKPITKPFFKKCFECNTKLKTSEESDDDILDKLSDKLPDEITAYKKQNIPKCVKNALWCNYFESRIGICQCCMREPITINNFHAGHVIAERDGGTTTLDNMKPICPLCNGSMGRENMDDFIKRYNLHYGLKK